jgi:hypothetical protein
MRNRGFIQSIPNVKDYVSLYNGPWNKQIDDYIKLEELVNKIVAENTQQEVNKDKEGQVYLESLPLVSHQEVLYALHTLRWYEKAYKGLDEVFLRALRSFERDLVVRYHGALKQVALDKFWNK